MSQPLVLCYHAVAERWTGAIAVSPERLRSQLTSLLGKGYEAVTFSTLVLGETPRRALAITFDDGFCSVFDRARPIMEDLGIPGTVFVPAGLIGQPGPMRWPGIDKWLGTEFENELTPMTWDQLRTLQDAGWEVGSHTVSHPRLTELDDEALADQLVNSRERCSRELGRPCRTLAYPYGNEDQRVQEAARDAGYAAAASLSPGPLNHLCWPRTGIYSVDGDLRFRIKSSAKLMTLRGTAVGRALNWFWRIADPRRS